MRKHVPELAIWGCRGANRTSPKKLTPKRGTEKRKRQNARGKREIVLVNDTNFGGGFKPKP